MTGAVVMVVNPASGGGRNGRAWPALARRLDEANIAFTAAMTERRGDGTILARAALRAGATTVVAVGGDGTANEVINGFFKDGQPINPEARFGMIPGGTGNDLARDLGLAGDAAFAALDPGGGTRHVDLLHVRYTSADGGWQERYALQGLFMAVVAEGAAVALPPRVKRFGGGAAYMLGGAVAVMRHRPTWITYRLDDDAPQSAFINGGVIANTAFIGGGLEIAPGARVDDGIADVIMVRAIGRLRLMRLMPRLRGGTHLAHPAVSRHTARRIRLETEDAVLLAIDGEVIGWAPAEASIRPRALPIALPPPP